MNFQHLKYVLEVEKTRSVSKAAENLLMGQPNLSRSIRELEESLGITIFKRTPKGVTPTAQGEAFLADAKRILSIVDEVQAKHRIGREQQRFSISVPRASYIAHAFAGFVKKAELRAGAAFYYKETNALRAINNILYADYALAIVRCQEAYASYFSTMFHDKGLKERPVWTFQSLVTLSKANPLAERKLLHPADLRNFTEITHADPYIPSLPFEEIKKAELSDITTKRIFVFERGSQFELLAQQQDMFLWASPIPAPLLELHGLVQLPCQATNRRYRDVLVCKKDYRLSELDTLFLEELQQVCKDLQP